MVVDGGSSENTLLEISKFESRNSKQIPIIKLLISKGASIAEGRNIGIKNAAGEIIVTTDAGCIAKKNWLEKITKPFDDKNTAVVAGFYLMKTNNLLSQAAQYYLGVVPQRFEANKVLPSARSMAFRKEVWKKVGGFRENLDRAGEDIAFCYDVLKKGFKIIRVKNAIVYWQVPNNLRKIISKFFVYAKGDAQTKIWKYKGINILSHNIKI